ncbi:MAG: hypothetical protein U0Q11_04675 [Vicinamibacterales bacterium]
MRSSRSAPRTCGTRSTRSCNKLEDTVAPRVLGQGEAFTLFRRLLGYTPEKDGVRVRPDARLDFDATRTRPSNAIGRTCVSMTTTCVC